MSIAIKIDGQAVLLGKNTLNISARIEQRETCSFQVVDVGGTQQFYKGQPVVVRLNSVVKFYGTLTSANITNTTPQGDRWHMIKATGHHYAADKRLAAKVYEDEYPGEIVMDLWESYLLEEGVEAATVWDCTFDHSTNTITPTAFGSFLQAAYPMSYSAMDTLSNDDPIRFYTTDTLPAELSKGRWYYIINKTDDDFQVSETVGGAVVAFTDNGTGDHTFRHDFTIDQGDTILEEAVFNYVPVSQCYEALAERTGLWWRIDENRQLYFTERSRYAAPFTLTENICRKGSIRVDHTNPMYRNQQIITGVRDITDPQVDVRKGDGVANAFTTGFAVAREPVIKVARDKNPSDAEWNDPDAHPEITVETVGIRGLQTDRDWYWGSSEFVIQQDWNGTVLGTNDYIRVEYRGEYPMVIKTRSPSGIAERKGVEKFGTGIVEDVKQEPASRTREGSFQLAAQLLEKYTQIGRNVRAATWHPGLAPGQILTTDLPHYGVAPGTEILIESVTTVQSNDVIYYEIQAVEGPEMKSWTKFFEQIVTRGDARIREGIGEDEMIILPFDFEKTWVEVEEPNIFKLIYPDAGHTPGGVYPSFDPAHRIRYLEWWHDGAAAGRKLITDSTGLDTEDIAEVFTLTYLDPTEAVGTITDLAWIGGIDATTVLGTGVEVDKQNETITADPGAAPWIKSDITAFQVNKTDTRWA